MPGLQAARALTTHGKNRHALLSQLIRTPPQDLHKQHWQETRLLDVERQLGDQVGRLPLPHVVLLLIEVRACRLDVTTDQTAIQLYSCGGLYNASLPIPRKFSQGGPLAHYTQYSCVVIEQASSHPSMLCTCRR
jgi:hypothetical protein